MFVATQNKLPEVSIFSSKIGAATHRRERVRTLAAGRRRINANTATLDADDWGIITLLVQQRQIFKIARLNRSYLRYRPIHLVIKPTRR